MDLQSGDFVTEEAKTVKRFIVFCLIAAMGYGVLVFTQSDAALTVTKTLLYKTRQADVYRAAVTFDDSYAAGGEELSMADKGSKILHACMESFGYATSDTAAYFVNIEDSTFTSATLQLLVYQIMSDSTFFREVADTTDLSGLTGVRLIIHMKR